jgi:hypothetical protein
VLLSGNLGDPIYHSEFLEIYKGFTDRGAARIEVMTNGSYKSSEWWSKFAQIVRPEDTIIFSIDGTPYNFTKYRINADWKTIEIGIRAMVNSPAKVMWKYIPFSFNEDTIHDARADALTLGVDEFRIVTSGRWIENDYLKPSVGWSRPRPGTTQIFAPECKQTLNAHFVSAAGYFYPCCYAADYRLVRGTQFELNPEFHIRNSPLSYHLADGSKYRTFLDKLEEQKLPACKFCCTK